jgi:hypothetical protein
MDVARLTQDVAWLQWLVALLPEPSCLITDTLDTLGVFDLVRVLDAVFTVILGAVMAAEAEVVTLTHVPASVSAGPVSFTNASDSVVDSVFDTGVAFAVGWAITALAAWVTVAYPDSAAGLCLSLVMLPAWLADTLALLVPVRILHTLDTVDFIWTCTAVAGDVAVILNVLTTVIAEPPIIADTAAIPISIRGVHAMRIGHTLHTASHKIPSLVIESIAPVTNWVAVGSIEAAVLSRPVFVALTSNAAARRCSDNAVKDAGGTVVVRWSSTVLAPLVALTDVLFTVLSCPVIVAGTDTELVPVGVLVTGVALFWEEASWAACTSMRAFPNPLITELPSPVRLTNTANLGILLSVFDTLFAVVEGWACTELTAVLTGAVVLAAVRAEPVIVADTFVAA